MAEPGSFAPTWVGNVRWRRLPRAARPETVAQEACTCEPTLASTSWSSGPARHLGAPAQQGTMEAWALHSFLLVTQDLLPDFSDFASETLADRIFCTTIWPPSPNFSSIIYLQVRSKCALYELPTFKIQPVAPLHSKLLERGQSTHISHSAHSPKPPTQLPCRQGQGWPPKSPNLLPRKKNLLGNSLQDLCQENRTPSPTGKSQGTVPFPAHGWKKSQKKKEKKKKLYILNVFNLKYTRESKPKLSTRAERCPASILLVYTLYGFYLLCILEGTRNGSHP